MNLSRHNQTLQEKVRGKFGGCFKEAAVFFLKARDTPVNFFLGKLFSARKAGWWAAAGRGMPVPGSVSADPCPMPHNDDYRA